MKACDPRHTAHTLLARGLWPVPVRAGLKAPLGHAWGKYRPTAESIDSAYARHPGAGVGILLGPEGGVIDIEIDGREGEDILTALFGGEPPETLGWSSTRGPHRIFRYDPRLERLGKSKVNLPGLEVRLGGHGKQLQSCCPPTVGDDGKPRRWNECDTIAELPETVLDYLFQHARRQEHERRRPDKSPEDRARAYVFAPAFPDSIEGQRGHDRLYHVACVLIDGFGLTREQAWPIFREWNQAKAIPPETDEQIAHKLDDAIRNNPSPSLNLLNARGASGAKGQRRTTDRGLLAQEPQSEILLRLASVATPFRCPLGRLYCAVPIEGHIEVHEIGSTRFRLWLKRQYYLERKATPHSQAFQAAIDQLQAMAMHEGVVEPVYVRVAGDATRSIVDLGDPSWRVIEITADGWKIADQSPVRFSRPIGALELPTPERGGSLDQIREIANSDANDRALLIAWWAAALRPTGPYPTLVLTGEQGSAKSTLAEILKLLIDPHVAVLRSEPRELRDLMIGAVKSWILAFDNLSALPIWLSDGLCRLSTGGALAVRKLFSDDDEIFLDAMRPVILNGITDVVVRGDLIDRCLFIHLPTIPEEKRLTQSEVRARFNAVRPKLLGALFDAVAAGLRVTPRVRPAALPRLADFAIFGEAVSRGLGKEPDLFLAEYNRNRQDANESALADSLVAEAIRELVSGDGPWSGTASELLATLVSRRPSNPPSLEKSWPRTPRALSGNVRRLAPQLRMVGVEVEFGKRGSRRRPINIRPLEIAGNRPSPPSSASPDRDFQAQTDDGPPPTRPTTVTEPSSPPGTKTRHCDDGDGSDGQMPGFSTRPAELATHPQIQPPA